MAKTAIVWLFISFGGITYSFFKGPIYALLVYVFGFYTQFQWMHRHGAVGRWSLIVSLGLLASYLVNISKSEKLSHFKIAPLKWLIFFAINMLVVSTFAVDPKANTKVVSDVLKVFVIYYLIVSVVRTKLHYRMFMWLQLWGNFLWGWQGYNSNLSGGRLENVGGPSTRTSNGLANHMIMILPFMSSFFFFGNKWEKIAVVLAAPWILNAIVLCNSRGAFLGILAMCVLALIRSDRKIRKQMIAGLILGSIMFVYLADDRFWTRMVTITADGQEGSGRITTWLGALEMIGDYPLGAGGDGWLYYSPVYIPEIVAAHGGRRSVHNSYLNVATNFGIQGLALYLLFFGSTLLELHNMRGRSGSTDDEFYFSQSTAVEISIWGFLVAGMFGSRPYFEFVFWVCALGIALSNIQQSEIKDRKALLANTQAGLSEETTQKRALTPHA